ncbi:MAG: TIGR02452 family protein, partial [Candidatus Parabeggiatoa sp.]|nr:TIGR02452 family protein [Candidatus Parabeggiatoa sp.]
KILSLAASYGCDALVLGAWGCGVFRNDPEMVAKAFYEHLYPQGAFWGFFQKVLFSVLDTSSQQKTVKAFYDCFSGMTNSEKYDESNCIHNRLGGLCHEKSEN